MRPQTLALTMETADRNGICVAQTTAGAGNLTITGAYATAGVATFDVPRHLSIYSAGDLSAITFTVTGTNRYNDALTEAITGPTAGATVKGSRNFKTITKVAVDAAVGTNVELGTADELESQWCVVNYRARGPSYSIHRTASANVTHNFQYTLDDIFNSRFKEYGATVFSVGENTADQTGYLADQKITAWRIKLTAFVTGTVTANVLQE